MDFIQAQKRFEQLKTQFSAGRLSEAQFKSQLEELMIQDEKGDWWTIGYETEKWYRHDGKDWVRTNPPDIIPQISTPQAIKQETGTSPSTAKPEEQKTPWRFGKNEIVQCIIGLVIFILLYFIFGKSSSPLRYWSPAFAIPLFFGLVFGPVVGGALGGVLYIVNGIFTFYQYNYSQSGISFFNLFPIVGGLASVIPGLIMGSVKIPPQSYRSFKSILRVELFVILANLARILFSINLGSVFGGSNPDYLKIVIFYPMVSSLIIVPISAIIYAFIISHRKIRIQTK